MGGPPLAPLPSWSAWHACLKTGYDQLQTQDQLRKDQVHGKPKPARFAQFAQATTNPLAFRKPNYVTMSGLDFVFGLALGQLFASTEQTVPTISNDKGAVFSKHRKTGSHFCSFSPKGNKRKRATYSLAYRALSMYIFEWAVPVNEESGILWARYLAGVYSMKGVPQTC